MEDQDKLFEQFRASAEKAEEKSFDRMEALWNRVEDKLDREEQRKSATWWKYTGIAAVLVLFITVGTFLYRENGADGNPNGIPENNITVIDTQRVKDNFEPNKAAVVEQAVVVSAANKERNTTRAADKLTYDTLYPGRIQYRALPSQIGQVDEISSDVDSNYAEAYAGETAHDDGHTITFSGIVTDEKGMPLPGAIVKVDGTASAVLSDINGRYTISTKEGEKITASYIGMKSGTVLAYKANNNRKVALAEDNRGLAGSTANGLRADSKAKYTALKDLTPQEIEDPNSGFMPSVSGTVAVIDEGKIRKREKEDKNTETIVYKANALASNKESDQGSKEKAYLGQQAVPADSATNNRFPDDALANGNPMYIVDGVITSESIFRETKAEDIVSITVLKDANATAVYGTRAKDGVIIIKTKKGLTKSELKKLEREMKQAYKETKKKLEAIKKQ